MLRRRRSPSTRKSSPRLRAATDRPPDGPQSAIFETARRDTSRRGSARPAMANRSKEACAEQRHEDVALFRLDHCARGADSRKSLSPSQKAARRMRLSLGSGLPEKSSTKNASRYSMPSVDRMRLYIPSINLFPKAWLVGKCGQSRPRLVGQWIGEVTGSGLRIALPDGASLVHRVLTWNRDCSQNLEVAGPPWWISSCTPNASHRWTVFIAAMKAMVRISCGY